MRFVFAVDGTVEGLNSVGNSAIMLGKVFPDSYVSQNIRIFNPRIIPLDSAHNLIIKTFTLWRHAQQCLLSVAQRDHKNSKIC